MTLIYEPKGPAREYAARACNLYKGCGHKCEYCYGPYFAYQFIDHEEAKRKFDEPTVRGKAALPVDKRIEILLRKLEREAEQYSDLHKVLMSFTSDCYQPLEEELELTKRAIEIFGEARVPVTVLTKSSLALRDIDLFKKYDVELATTICFLDEKLREKYEPGASPIRDRFKMLAAAERAGLTTWVSIEPIVDHKEAVKAVKKLVGKTDKLKIGTVDNRWDPGLYDSIDWRGLLDDVLDVVHDEQSYYIKNGLWKFANESTKYPREK